MACLCVPVPDSELVSRARSGDRSAFGELVQRHYRTCVGIASYMLRDSTQAQDEVQNACWKAFAHIEQYQGTAEFSSWLFRIVENECLMLMRVQRRAQFVYIDSSNGSIGRATMELPAHAADPEHDMLKRQLAEVVRREMGRLPRLLRDVIVLRDIEGLPLSRCAARLGVTIAAAKSRLLRARCELRSRALMYCGKNGFHISASAVRTLPARPTQSVTHLT